MNLPIMLLLLAAADGPTANEIAEKAVTRSLFSASNARAEVHIEVTKRKRVVRTRRLRTVVRQTDKDTRTLVEFQAPADVAGTRFLSIDPRNDDAEQYIFLPAFKKVKRVIGAQRQRSFMGTDYSYADLEGREVSSADWKRLDDAKIKGQKVYVIEGISKSKKAPYQRTIFYVHPDIMVPLRIEFFLRARNAQPTKRFNALKLKNESKRWVVTTSRMETLSKGTSTRLEVLKMVLDADVDEQELTRQALEP